MASARCGRRRGQLDRLRTAGLNVDRIKAALRPGRVQGDLPAWAHTLDKVMAAARAASTQENVPSQNPVPFEELLRPFLSVARDAEHEGNVKVALLSPLAQHSLERYLLPELSALSWQAFHFEFALFRTSRHRFAMHQIPLGDAVSNEAYRGFVDQLRRDGLQTFFETFPVLARLMSIRCNQWTDSVREFFSVAERYL